MCVRVRVYEVQQDQKEPAGGFRLHVQALHACIHEEPALGFRFNAKPKRVDIEATNFTHRHTYLLTHTYILTYIHIH
jgi:hypothetical protein